jgi:hypothetical protein
MYSRRCLGDGWLVGREISVEVGDMVTCDVGCTFVPAVADEEDTRYADHNGTVNH